MSLNRWEELKRLLHFNDNEKFIAPGQIGHNKLQKAASAVASEDMDISDESVTVGMLSDLSASQDVL
ncbi:hypothetical protein V5799_008268, partial [Amblyomma americanum]